MVRLPVSVRGVRSGRSFPRATGVSALPALSDDFGLIPNASGDQSAQLNAAGAAGKTVLFRPGVYRGNNLTLSTNTIWMSFAAGGSSTDASLSVLIIKNANGPLITLSGGSQKLVDISLEGLGATFTGDNLLIPPGTSLDFEWRNGSNLGAAGYPANFNGTTSSGRERFVGGVWANQGATLPAFRLPSAEGGSTDKVLERIFCIGGDLADFNGCQTVMVSACDFRNCTFGAASHKVTMVGNRIATSGADTVIFGINHTIVGNTHAGRFVIDSTCVNSVVGPNVTTVQSVNNSPSCSLITAYNGNTMPEYSQSAGLNGYITPQPSIFPMNIVGVVMTSNQAYLNRLVVSEPTTVTKVAFHVSVAAAANDNIDLGIYDSTGTLLASQGSTAGLVNSTGIKTVTLTAPTTLLPGRVYWVAIAYGTPGGAAATLQGGNINNSNNALLFGLGTSLPYAQNATSFPLPGTIAPAAPSGLSQPLLAARTS